MKTLIYVILACITITDVLILYLLYKVFQLENRFKEFEKQRLEENMGTNENIARLEDRLYEMKEYIDNRLRENREPEETVQDSIEKQIEEAREKVFTEWIQNIVNYSPTGG